MRISEYNAPIAENIERIINEKGLKKAFVAQKAGCTAQMLSDMISGRKIIKALYQRNAGRAERKDDITYCEPERGKTVFWSSERKTP